MKEFLTSICSYIGGKGLGTVGTDLFAGFVPETPAAVTCVLLNGGPWMVGEPLHKKSVQVIYRDPDPATAITKANSLFLLFDNQWGDFQGYRGRFVPEHEPGLHVIDPRGHYVYTLNFRFHTIENHPA